MPPAATMGDTVAGTCVHIIMIPSPAGPVPTPIPHPFTGKITGGCETTVLIGNKPAAVIGATVTNTPPHIPQGPSFGPPPPSNSGSIIKGSLTVLIGGKPAARMGDLSTVCTTSVVPAPAPVIGSAMTVIIGG
jgi:uncharacterized Zn-binding protein involved in type VI secretion